MSARFTANFKTINSKIQAVALIGVVGFVTYFLLSLKSNYQYENLFADLTQNDLQILELSNDVNLKLNQIESITQSDEAQASQDSARKILEQMKSSFVNLKKLDKQFSNDIEKLSNLSDQYAKLLIELSLENVNADLDFSKLNEARSMAQDIVRLRDEYRGKRVSVIEKKIERSHTIASESLSFSIAVGLLLALAMLLLARYFASGVTETLSYVSSIAGKISRGNWDVKIQSDTSDETAEVLRAMESMRDALKLRAQEDTKRDEEQKRLMALSELGRGELSLVHLCQAIMRQLSPMLNAQVGAMYLVEEKELEELQSLRLVASYAFVHRKGMSDYFEFGEGIVGQVALEKTQVVLSDVPENYLTISSALGEGRPSFVVITPLVFNEHLYGVLELGFMRDPQASDLSFLLKVGELIAQYIESTKARESVRLMLVKTQEQAEKLEQQQRVLQATNEDLEAQAMALTESEGRLLAQQEELRVSNEELEEQAKALKISEERLQAQQEELRVTNEELEEHAKALEKQKKDMQIKNQELEESRHILEEKTKALELSGQYKSEFMSTMSHELRTPLNSILILSENLSENDGQNLTDKQVEHAKVIYKAGSDLLSLINDILDLAKVEEGKLELLLDEVEFSEWATEMNQLFSPVSERKGIDFFVNIDEALEKDFSTDVKRLNQILKNLLSNALKFTEKGSVTLSVTPAPLDLKLNACNYPPEELIAFSVRDTGLGIEKEKQSLIFEAFQQSDGAISRKFGGTGLGLTISNRLAKLLGGEITVESEGLGQGSCFTLYIPRQAPDALFSEDLSQELLAEKETSHQELASTSEDEELADSEAHQEEVKNTSNKLLIVEDDPVFSETLASLAQEYGLDVILADDGETAIELAEKNQPQGIILDLILPGIGGFDVLEALNENPKTKSIPVHVMSGKEGKEKALSMGAIDFLKKPVSKKKLVELLSHFQTSSQDIKSLYLIEAEGGQSFQQLKELFNEQGVNVESFNTVKKLINALKKKAVDCIIFDLDFVHKGKSEKETLEQLEQVHLVAQQKGASPIIVCSDSEIDREQEAGLRKFADRIILKSNASEERLISEASLLLHWLGNKSEQAPKVEINSRDTLFSGKRVLIVDDDMRNVYSLTSELERRGMEVEAAESGVECIKILQAEDQPFDMVLMDIMMPELDGFSTIEQVRADSRFEDLPIIVLTAKSLKEDRVRCLELGANDYLLKPIDVERLMALMRVWMT